MNENENDALGYNRRDFLKGGSVATLMTMLGGVELFAQTNAAPAGEPKPPTIKIKVAVIGLGAWGREIINTLGRMPQADIPIDAEIAAICDTYPASLKRAASLVPGAAQTADYKTILDNKDIKAVIIATPTPNHKEVALAALKAGKHVYCEAPLAGSIEDAREIALAGKAAKHLVFQAGLQMRSDKQRLFLLPFVRTGPWARPSWRGRNGTRRQAGGPPRPIPSGRRRSTGA